VTDDVTSLDGVVFLYSLMRNVADEDDAVPSLGMNHDVLLGLAPGLELRPVEGIFFEVPWFERMPPLDELEVSDARSVVLEIKSGVDTHRRDGKTVFLCSSLLLPVTVEVEMPLLVVGPRIDVSPKASELALRTHHAFQNGADALVAYKRSEGLWFTVQKAVKPHIPDFIQPLFPAVLSRLIDMDTDLLGLLRVERAWNEDKTFALQLVED